MHAVDRQPRIALGARRRQRLANQLDLGSRRSNPGIPPRLAAFHSIIYSHATCYGRIGKSRMNTKFSTLARAGSLVLCLVATTQYAQSGCEDAFASLDNTADEKTQGEGGGPPPRGAGGSSEGGTGAPFTGSQQSEATGRSQPPGPGKERIKAAPPLLDCDDRDDSGCRREQTRDLDKSGVGLDDQTAATDST